MVDPVTTMVVKFGRGGSLPRVEDSRLLIGGGRYLDDLAFDALKDFGVVHLDMPICAEDVWRAINSNS